MVSFEAHIFNILFKFNLWIYSFIVYAFDATSKTSLPKGKFI